MSLNNRNHCRTGIFKDNFSLTMKLPYEFYQTCFKLNKALNWERHISTNYRDVYTINNRKVTNIFNTENIILLQIWCSRITPKSFYDFSLVGCLHAYHVITEKRHEMFNLELNRVSYCEWEFRCPTIPSYLQLFFPIYAHSPCHLSFFRASESLLSSIFFFSHGSVLVLLECCELS